MNPPGYNPLRWKCAVDGCFNEVQRPKIEMFSGCFPGKINFGDVDSQVEVNGFFAQLEWKGVGIPLREAQYIALTRFSRLARAGIQGNAVFFVNGDAATMNVKRYGVFWHGLFEDRGEAGFQRLFDEIKRWCDWAISQPRDPSGLQDWHRAQVARRCHEQLQAT